LKTKYIGTLVAVLAWGLVVLILNPAVAVAEPQPAQAQVRFRIERFDLTGNTLFDDDHLFKVLTSFIGHGKTSDDVEGARRKLETYYHKQGYPTVLVNIPEQAVDDGVIRLEVIESKLRRVRVVGNRYFTMERILDMLPSFRQGQILYLPNLQEELAVINQSPDIKVAPVLMPGKTPGTIDVDLKVKDKLPLHGSIELNNRSTHNTEDLRLNVGLNYSNLWQKEHTLSLQYQTSPQDPEQVQAVSASYVMPSPLNHKHIMALFGVVSDSDTAIGEDFSVIGKGFMAGLRNVIPLPAARGVVHSFTIGIDYKDFEEDLSALGVEDEGVVTPVTYLPLIFSYGASFSDKTGMTGVNAAVTMALRGVVTDQEEFEDKRFKARGNYIYATLEVERIQKLGAWGSIMAKVDGQLSNQPLIANEQYTAGGMKSVRGYKESETAGDNALHATVELRTPDLEALTGLWEPLDLFLFGFYDVAALHILDSLPGEDEGTSLAAAGAGVRGRITDHLTYEVDWGTALEDTQRVESGEEFLYFEVRLKF
jgi:hemolysin activation/secretion protein